MDDKVLNLFVDLLEKIAINSSECRERIRKLDTNALLDLLDQRSILINIYKTLQIKISQDYKVEKKFEIEIDHFFKKIAKFDEEILEYLESEKEKTKIEICRNFKNRETLKGYNLNTTK